MAGGLRADEIVARLGGELRGDGGTRVRAVAPPERARADEACFITSADRAGLLASTAAGCAIVPPALVDAASGFACVILTPNPYLYFARLAGWLAELAAPPRDVGVHASAVVDPSARIAPDASVGPCAVIEADADIGPGVVIGAGSFVGRGTVIGEASVLEPRVVVAHGCRIGARCILHSGAVIGADGFGFARDEQGRGVKIPQTGGVRIGDDVEIGANTAIDRGAMDDTVICDGVKIDNLVQVGHNVRIGEHTAIAGSCGIAGSARIGAYCFIAGKAGIAGHLDIADRTVIGPMSMVSRSVRRAGHYTGAFPLDTHERWTENAAALRHLADLRERVRALERELGQEQHKDPTS